MVNLTPSLWALWKHVLQLEFDEEHRENETVEFTWRRPLKEDSFPPNTSTLRLKPPLTFLPSVDSNVRQNTVHCCTVWLILRYSWHESTWSRAHRWNSSADRSERICLMLIRVPDSLPAGWLIWITCTGSLAVKYLGQSEKDGAQLETVRRRKKLFFFPTQLPCQVLRKQSTFCLLKL